MRKALILTILLLVLVAGCVGQVAENGDETNGNGEEEEVEVEEIPVEEGQTIVEITAIMPEDGEWSFSPAEVTINEDETSIIRVSVPENAPGNVGFLCDTLGIIKTIAPGETIDIEVTPIIPRESIFMNHLVALGSKVTNMRGYIIVV